MAVTAAYLKKIRTGVRIQSDTDFDAELTDIIEECRLDLQAVGVTSAKASDESDSLVLGAVRSFARWKFPVSDKSAEQNRGDYMIQRDEMRRRAGYMEESDVET